MRKIVSLVLVIALCVSCLAFRGYAAESDEVESGIVEALRSVEPIKEQLGLSSVDFDQLTTSNHIFAYDYTNTGFVYNAEFIPIKHEGVLIGWVIKAPHQGDNIYQFSTTFVEKVNDHLDILDEFAIIYDAQSSYLYNGVDLIKLEDVGVAVNNRAEVTEEKLLDTEVVLNSIDASLNLEYTNNVANTRASSLIFCDVDFVSQYPIPTEDTSLCWAASAACIINYLRGTSYASLSIAQNWYGNTNYNQTLLMEDAVDVLERYNVYYSFRAQIPSETIIVNNVGNGYPIFGSFSTNRAHNGAHNVVIHGINPFTRKLYVMDPTFGFGVANWVQAGWDMDDYVYYNAVLGENMSLYYALCQSWTT